MTEADVEKLFGYIPIDGLAIAAAALFALLGIVLAYVNIKFRPCKFLVILVVTAFCEVAGYAIRIVAHHYPNTLNFIITTLFILLSPNAIALVNYMVAGRVLALSGLNVGCLRPTWIAKAFVTSDIVSFCVQGFGGALLVSAKTASQLNTGKAIIMVGLAVQCASLFLFLFVSLSIQRGEKYGMHGKRDARLLFLSLYATTAMMFIRSVYRLVEYGVGQKSYIGQHEWIFYVFDTIPILSCFVLYCVPNLHYGRCLNSLTADFQAALPQEMHSTEPDEPPLVVNVVVHGPGHPREKQAVAEAWV